MLAANLPPSFTFHPPESATLLLPSSPVPLLSFMPELENLHINFDSRYHDTPIFEAIQSGLASTPLQCLEIGKVHMTEATLTQLVASFEQSIEKLVLLKVRQT